MTATAPVKSFAVPWTRVARSRASAGDRILYAPLT